VSSSLDLRAAIAVTRFGLGARPGEMARAAADPKGYLKAQIRSGGAPQPPGQLKSSAEMLDAYEQYQTIKQQAKRANKDDSKAVRREAKQEVLRDGEFEEIAARARLAATTDAAFAERWALFWANHFTVSRTRGAAAAVIGPFEREAIRPHAFGRFEDMLIAGTRHPAMLIYLNQSPSTGPNSPAGGGRRGLNENLAREILELHTVGVDAGYTQADVTEFAKALTGWSTPRIKDGAGAQPFLYRANAHEPGARTIMGRTYPDTGQGQAVAVLKDLAAHPGTARHIARKVAVHFVADEPPPALVERLAGSFRASRGRLDRLAETLVDSPEAWEPTQRKFKTPYEFVVSGWRALDDQPDKPREVLNLLTKLGQRPFAAPAPKGWPDDASSWSAPTEIIDRMDVTRAMVARASLRADPRQLAQQALGPLLRPRTLEGLARAETPERAVSLVLLSPEFQRR
jgi:uncharacterized protein (DUF1800 family)